MTSSKAGKLGITLLALVGGISMIFVVVVIFSVVRAYVLCDLWSLFITPHFGVESPPFWSVMGILLMISVVTGHKPDEEYELHDGPLAQDKKAIKKSFSWTSLVVSCLQPLMAWGIGHAYFWLSQ